MKTLKKFISAFMLVQMIIGFVLPSVYCEELNNNGRPKVSVIVPVYKAEQYLRECLDSIKNQTLKDIEVICVDDGSPDNCGKILDEYAKEDSRIKVIHQKNSGVQMARNAGLDVATGEYIALVDSDDYLDLRAYETAYNLAKKDNLDILNFGHRKFKEGKDNHINNIDFSDRPVLTIENYIQNNYRNYVWDNIFKSEIIQKEKIRFIPGIKPADDTCFTYMALGRAKTVKSIPAKFYNYRILPGSLSRMSERDIFLNSYKMIKYICDSWREGNCLKNNEHNLLTLAVRWLNLYRRHVMGPNNKFAKEILNSFGSDVYNPRIVAKCPKHVRNYLKELEQHCVSKNSRNKKVKFSRKNLRRIIRKRSINRAKSVNKRFNK